MSLVDKVSSKARAHTKANTDKHEAGQVIPMQMSIRAVAKKPRIVIVVIAAVVASLLIAVSVWLVIRGQHKSRDWIEPAPTAPAAQRTLDISRKNLENTDPNSEFGVFNKMVMIDSYIQKGNCQEARKLYGELEAIKNNPAEHTMASVKQQIDEACK